MLFLIPEVYQFCRNLLIIVKLGRVFELCDREGQRFGWFIELLRIYQVLLKNLLSCSIAPNSRYTFLNLSWGAIHNDISPVYPVCMYAGIPWLLPSDM